MIKQIPQKSCGFTMIEVLITLTISSAILITGGALTMSLYKNNQQINSFNLLHTNATQILTIISTDIRESEQVTFTDTPTNKIITLTSLYDSTQVQYNLTIDANNFGTLTRTKTVTNNDGTTTITNNTLNNSEISIDDIQDIKHTHREKITLDNAGVPIATESNLDSPISPLHQINLVLRHTRFEQQLPVQVTISATRKIF